MPARTLLGAGIVAFLAGVFLYWMLAPVSSGLEEIFPYNNWTPGIVICWLSLSLAGAGGLLLFRGVFCLLSKRARAGTSLFPDMKLRSVLRFQRHRPSPPFAQLPNFGLMYGAVLWVLIVLHMTFPQLSPYGLPIDWRAPNHVIEENSPWPKALGVYLGVGEKFYINGEPVPREGLEARLREELGHRLEWTVYFEADYDTLNGNAIYAMDTIRGAGGKLVWITPKMREELRPRRTFQPLAQSLLPAFEPADRTKHRSSRKIP